MTASFIVTVLCNISKELLIFSSVPVWFPTIHLFNQQITTVHYYAPDTIPDVSDKAAENKIGKDCCSHGTQVLARL